MSREAIREAVLGSDQRDPAVVAASLLVQAKGMIEAAITILDQESRLAQRPKRSEPEDFGTDCTHKNRVQTMGDNWSCLDCGRTSQDVLDGVG